MLQRDRAGYATPSYLCDTEDLKYIYIDFEHSGIFMPK